MNPPKENAAVLIPMRKSQFQGFSLVEVVLALGVIAFAFVAILGLIPAGMSTFRQSINISVCSQIGQKVVADAFQADFDTLMTPPGSSAASTGGLSFQGNLRYFDEEGNEIDMIKHPIPNPPTASVYTVNTKINPTMSMPGAGSTSTQTAVITVQVIYNPGVFSLSQADFSNGLLVSSIRIPKNNVYTYYAHITRN